MALTATERREAARVLGGDLAPPNHALQRTRRLRQPKSIVLTFVVMPSVPRHAACTQGSPVPPAGGAPQGSGVRRAAERGVVRRRSRREVR